MVFSCNFYDISYANFLITLFSKKVSHYIVIMYIILKISIGYYIFNINLQLLYMKLSKYNTK